MAEQGGRWKGWGRALWLAAALAAVAATPAPAAAQARPVPSDSGLVTALVVSSAVLRQQYERRAADDQFALLQELAKAQDDHKRARNDAKAARKDQLEAERALVEVEARIAEIYDAQAKRDAAFAAEQMAMREQIERVVAEASPAKRAALERYARGDRTGAYAEIKALTQIENDARRRAADLASARNLKGVLTLAYEQVSRGEGSMDEVFGLLEQINALDPADVETANLLISMLGHRDRYAEAVELVDRTKPHIKEIWGAVDLEVAALGFRLKVQPVRSAIAPLQYALFDVEKGDRASWSDTQKTSYCNAIDTLHDIDGISRLIEQNVVESTAVWCIEELAKLPTYKSAIFSLVYRLGEARAAERDIAKLRFIVERMGLALDGYVGLNDFPALRAYIVLRLELLRAKLAEFEGRRPDTLRAYEAVLTQTRMVLGAAGMADAAADEAQLKMEAGMRVSKGDAGGALELLEPPVRSYPDLPADLRGNWAAWLDRNLTLLIYAQAALQAGETAKARSAVERATPIMTALQWAHPIDQPQLVRATHGRVYGQYMQWALLAAHVRAAEGRFDEGEARLQGALSGLAPYADDIMLELEYPVFRQSAELLLGNLAAERGDRPLARQRYAAVIDDIRALAARENQIWHPWIPLMIEARMRLAQLDSNMTEIGMIRAELAAYAKDGRTPDPYEGWVQDAADWKVGRPIRWRYAQPKKVAKRD